MNLFVLPHHSHLLDWWKNQQAAQASDIYLIIYVCVAAMEADVGGYT